MVPLPCQPRSKRLPWQDSTPLERQRSAAPMRAGYRRRSRHRVPLVQPCASASSLPSKPFAHASSLPDRSAILLAHAWHIGLWLMLSVPPLPSASSKRRNRVMLRPNESTTPDRLHASWTCNASRARSEERRVGKE